jgi:Flp pilus assembly protein TadG
MKRSERGIATVEIALILPVIIIIIFGAIELGWYIRARTIISNVCREGGSRVTRGNIQAAVGSANDEFTPLFTMLQASGKKIFQDNLSTFKIYISRIRAASASGQNPTFNPTLDQQTWGSLTGTTSSTSGSNFGLSSALYNRLTWRNPHPYFAEVWVVEVFYQYTPITPLAQFVPGVATGIMGSRAVF